MKIANHDIGPSHPVFIIAEACSNIIRHLDQLETFVLRASQTGATSLKIQLFRAEHFPRAEQSAKRRLEFPRQLVPKFVELCRKHNLLAGASVFDEEAVELLEKNNADFIKMAVREYNNHELYKRVRESPLPKIASFDWHEETDLPFSNNTVHLACTPVYPNTSLAVPDYGNSLWGWSSHYISGDRCLDCIIAVSKGARVIERHFALDGNDVEAGWSSQPNEFKQMVEDIRKVG